MRSRLEFVYNLVALAFSLMITYYMTKFVISTIDRNAQPERCSDTPLWIPQMLIPFGFALQSLVDLSQAVQAGRSGAQRA